MRSILLALAMAVSCVFGLRATAQNYPVSIGAGIEPELTAEQAAQLVLERLSKTAAGGVRIASPDGSLETPSPLPEVLAVDCVAGKDLRSVIPNTGAYFPDKEKIWVVQARGVFAKHGLGDTAIENDSGYFFINDETGEIFGRGSPAPLALPAGDPRRGNR